MAFKFLSRPSGCLTVVLCAFAATTYTEQTTDPVPAGFANKAGVRLSIDKSGSQPVLQVFLPGRPATDPAINVIFPEHVTSRKHGSSAAEHFYMWRPRQVG